MAHDAEGVLRGVAPGFGAGARYGFRVQGPYDPKRGLRFDPSKLLADPYAWRFRPAVSASILRCSSSARTPALTRRRRSLERRLQVSRDIKRIAPEALVIYELNLRGFSRLNPAIPEAARGTFAGLAHPASIDHLAKLGVTAIEIMPADTFIDDRHMPPLGLSDAWGYNAVVFGSPDPRLAPGGWEEVRAATDALHAAGMEAILDVVFNHNGESDEAGPTLSFRGLDNAAWFRLNPSNPELYVNDTGTGNCLALDRPLVVEMAIGALKRWMVYGGFDGFRFDLATTLGRRDTGFDPRGAVLSGARRRSHSRQGAPHRRTVGHRPRGLPPRPVPPRVRRLERPLPRRRAPLLARRPRAARRDRHPDGGVARRVSRAPPAPSKGVNFVVVHDGFTLRDLVSYEHKHNEANGENNRDGTDNNNSWNHGVEGPSDDPAIVESRSRDERNLLTAFARLARHADAQHGLGARLQPGRQQQRLRPGQRDERDRLARRRRFADRLHDTAHCGSPRQCRAVARRFPHRVAVRREPAPRRRMARRQRADDPEPSGTTPKAPFSSRSSPRRRATASIELPWR